MTQWKKSGDSYRLEDDSGKIVVETKEPAVAISKEGVFHKWGDCETVKNHADNVNKRLSEKGVFERFPDMEWVIISSKEWDVDELNKFSEIGDYGKTFIDKVLD